jgi:integrating conjugative element protein (TIGR03757 family)
MNKFLALLFLVLSVLSLQVNAITIDIFVDQPQSFISVPGVSITVHDLSAPERLSQRYLPELPPDPAQAKKMAMAFFASSKGKEYQHQLKDAVEHQTYLMRYNIQKIPAMVFDGKAVIYGSTDIQRGLEIYQNYLKKNEVQHEE